MYLHKIIGYLFFSPFFFVVVMDGDEALNGSGLLTVSELETGGFYRQRNQEIVGNESIVSYSPFTMFSSVLVN